jgi:hypothetical protein
MPRSPPVAAIMARRALESLARESKHHLGAAIAQNRLGEALLDKLVRLALRAGDGEQLLELGVALVEHGAHQLLILVLCLLLVDARRNLLHGGEAGVQIGRGVAGGVGERDQIAQQQAVARHTLHRRDEQRREARETAAGRHVAGGAVEPGGERRIGGDGGVKRGGGVVVGVDKRRVGVQDVVEQEH